MSDKSPINKKGCLSIHGKTAALVFILLVCSLYPASMHACTNVIVGKDASADGSVFCTYSCDSYGLFYGLPIYLSEKHHRGEMRNLVSSYSRIPRGSIPVTEEAEVDAQGNMRTYHVVGNINEWQVSIGESTFNVDSCLIDTTAMLDHSLLMVLALQRAKTARQAIRIITNLVEKYGFRSQGESFSVCDPNEAWLLEMVSQGPESGKAVWVALRIPDNAICAHANESRIRQFNMKDKQNVMYHKDVIKFARKIGRFSGKDNEFSFRDAYNPPKFSGRRACDARVWSFFNRFCKGMDKYLPYVSGIEETWEEELPVWVVPDRKLTLQDIQATMRDHYEGTVFEHGEDITRGLTNSPYPQGIAFAYGGKRYFNERYISSPQSAFSWICQMRAYKPREIGGIIWFGNDDGNMVAQTPVYCCATDVPPCYDIKGADDVTFSMDNAFWVCNWVSNMVYPRYNVLFPELKAVRDSLDSSYAAAMPAIEAKAEELLKTNRDAAIRFLSDYSVEKAQQMIDRWRRLAFFLIVKYNDMAEKPEVNGVFTRNQYGRGAKVKRLSYPTSVKRIIAEQTGERYMRPAAKQ